VIWQISVIEISVCLEGTLEVFLKYTRADDLLSFLCLRTGLGVVLAHVLIVGGTESNDALLTLVTDINSNQHGFLGDFTSEVKSP
jgi:hypothetical protein